MICPLRCDFNLSSAALTPNFLCPLFLLFSLSFLAKSAGEFLLLIMLGYGPTSEGSSSRSAATADDHHQQAAAAAAAAAPLSRYESQKRRDWNTFGQYLKNQTPPVSLSQCNCNHVLDFLRYLDQFGKTRVHSHGCVFFGQPDPPAPCPCPLKQAWGSLDALIGRLRAAYEEHGGSSEANPFGNGSIRTYLRQVKECQSKARGIPYKKKKKKRNQIKSNEENKALAQVA